MENVLISQNKHWQKKYKNIYKRDIFAKLINSLNVKHIQVLQGIRRSGKSTLFKLLINHLCDICEPEKILYINLDDPFFIKYSNDPSKLRDVVESAKKLTQMSVKYLFLDEVQAITGWERYVKSVYDNGEFEKIFITGSNSSLLNGKLSTLLSGRYLSVQVYPLSFKEILDINKITTNLKMHQELPKVLNLVDDMMKYGSFIEVYEQSVEFKRDILATYYESILLKDCVANNALRDTKSFKELSFYLLSNITSLYSYTSVGRTVGIHDKSAKEYISYLEDSYLCSELKHFSYSLKEQSNSKKKIYFSDNGFVSLSFSFSQNSGKLFENLVYTELIKNGFEVYFYNKDFECDFIVKKDGRILAIQVCYKLNEQNRKREFNGLLKLPFKVDKEYIVTYNQTQITKEVSVVSFFDFFKGEII